MYKDVSKSLEKAIAIFFYEYGPMNPLLQKLTVPQVIPFFKIIYNKQLTTTNSIKQGPIS